MAISNAQLATRVETLLQSWSRRERQYADWLAGTATGGPNGDGRYELTDGTGVTRLVDCPARLADGLSGPAALAQAALHSAELARDRSVSEATRSAAQAVLGEASRIAAEKARDRAVTAQEASQNHEANALVYRDAARAAQQGTQADRQVTEGLAAQVTEDAAEAVQAALDARAAANRAATFDPSAFAPKTHSHSLLTGGGGAYFAAPVATDTHAYLRSDNAVAAGIQLQRKDGTSLLTFYSDGPGTGGFLKDGTWRFHFNGDDVWHINDSGTWRRLWHEGSLPSPARRDVANTFTGNQTINGRVDVNGQLQPYNLRVNNSMFYPDGNHAVIVTGLGTSDRYWRFDANGFFYSLNGGGFFNGGVDAHSFYAGTGSKSAQILSGWMELRNSDYGPYIDFSKDASTDFHGRISYRVGDSRFQFEANGGNLYIGVGGAVNATSSDGSQDGRVVTIGGGEQLVSKTLAFSSAMNPQDNGASASLEVRGAGGGYGAWMKFHRPGAYGTYFGMFEDGRWGFGGWSTGAVIHEFWTSKNLKPMQNYNDGWVSTQDGYPRFYFSPNGRTYIRGGNGLETRNSADQWIMQHADDRTTYFAGAVYSDTNFYSGIGHWFRVRGSSGIYWEDYGGGWNMSDSTWLRAYGGKYIYTSTRIRCDDAFYVGEDRQPRFKSGTGAPSGGVDGDIYFQF